MKKRFSIVLACLLLLPKLAMAASASFSTPGTHTFQVPSYATMTVTVKGAGGGGGSGGAWWIAPTGYCFVCMINFQDGGSGGAGTQSSFNGSLIGLGGAGGTGSWHEGSPGQPIAHPGNPGASGGASGGASTAGSLGGAGARSNFPGWDNAPGADLSSLILGSGGKGGAGGGVVKTYAAGDLAAGSVVTVVVGAGGSGGIQPGISPTFVMVPPALLLNGGKGADGSVQITWIDAPPPLPPPPPMVASKPAHPLNVGQAGSLAGDGKSKADQAVGEGDVAFDPVAYCSTPDRGGRVRSANWVRKCLANFNQ